MSGKDMKDRLRDAIRGVVGNDAESAIVDVSEDGSEALQAEMRTNIARMSNEEKAQLAKDILYISVMCINAAGGLLAHGRPEHSAQEDEAGLHTIAEQLNVVMVEATHEILIHRGAGCPGEHTQRGHTVGNVN